MSSLQRDDMVDVGLKDWVFSDELDGGFVVTSGSRGCCRGWLEALRG